MSNFITPNKEVHKYIVGIDFGHGETSADICYIQWDDNFLKLEAPMPIEIFNGQKATKSVLLVENGTDINNELTSTYFVGQQAIEKYLNRHRQKSANTSNQSHFYCYFKQIPSLMEENGTVEVMKNFMRGIYLQIRKQRSELTDNNHIVYIACPSNDKKWTNDELKKYAEIALEAGLPLARIDDNSIGIIRESRAAFIKARYNPSSKYAIKEGILLIDFGSSTVDLTYYSSQYVQKPEDGGDDCGAYHVEDEIFNHLIQDVDFAKQCCEDSTSTSSAMKLGIRESKEKFYTSNSEELEISLSATKLSGGKVSGGIEKYYSDDDINKMLSSYKSSIKKCFVDYRDNILNNHPIKLVFLTGGASRMDFIKDIVCEVFDYQGEFYRETDPSLTISNGIALAGRADMRSAAMLRKLEADKSLSKDISTNVIDDAVSQMASKLVDKIEDKYSSFSTQYSNGNISGLETQIESAIKSVSFSAIISDNFKAVLRREVNSNVLPTLNRIVGDYFPDGTIENISSSRYISVSLSVNDSYYGNIVSDSVDSISEGFFVGAAKVTGAIVGGTVALGAGALAKGIGEIHDFFTDKESDKWKVNFGDVVDDVADDLIPSWRDKNTELSKERRQAVFSKFKENKSIYKTEIESKIKEVLKNDSALKTQINKVFKDEAIRYIREQVDKVRLMLN